MNNSQAGESIISLPQGGGALQGIGEKFSPDLHTGTGNFTVPIAIPAGRNGFQPQLNLVYSSGNGNGPFGMGWGLDIPGLSRKTSKGIPQYNADEEDVFILSGEEDLVPVQMLPSSTRYRPRTEGLFANIVRRRDATGDFWKVQSKDGLTSLYGTQRPADAVPAWRDPAAIADPLEPTKVFAWKLSRTEDPFGNQIKYDYERDGGEVGPHRWDQLYLRQIRYADYEENNQIKFLVSVTFEYEERPDQFSEYRAGFEIRTRRRCHRITVRTHADQELLTRSYDFIYLDQRPELSGSFALNGASLLSQMLVTGHDGDKSERMPTLEFSYTRFEPQKRKFSPLHGPDLPARSLSNADLELVDLFGNGLPNFMEMNGTVRYWRNLGGGYFEVPRSMQDAPAGFSLSDPTVQFIDANGDGRTDLLVTNTALSGYFPLEFGGRWDRNSFQHYAQAPSFSLADPEVRLVDLNGDGVTDAIRSGTRLECFFNDPAQGWNRTRWVERQAPEVFPNVNFSDPRVRFADMSGDGLHDITCIYDGNVEYWPNLGHGEWGKRIHMQNSPRFPFGYDPARILVGDVDGDGLADIVYLADTKVTLWINQAGNRWSDPITILGTPAVSDIDAVRLVDLLGTGISGVLWTRDWNGLSHERQFFLDFTGGVKPYLLTVMDNHAGAVTKVEYAPSTRFYLEDQKQADTHWKTTLPFPVHVVSRIEVIDQFSSGKLTTEYSYHQGYWDGVEREFRGFGMVEQRDSESFEKYQNNGLHDDTPFARVDRIYFSPPTLTRSWFNEGPVDDDSGDWQQQDWSSQYWQGDPPLLKHTEAVNQFLMKWPVTPQGRKVKRDALRTLRGSLLRAEVYTLDDGDRTQHPYTVSEFRYDLDEIDPPALGDVERKRVFCPHLTAQRTTQWERGNDPMVQFSFTSYKNDAGIFDPFGRPLSVTKVACPRGWRQMGDRPAEPYLATQAQILYATPNDINKYIHTRVAKTTTFELTNTSGKTVDELAATTQASANLTIIGQALSFYDGDPFVGLPSGQIGNFAALTRSESLVLTDKVLQDAYGDAIPPYLEPTGIPNWTPDYPGDFQALLPPRAGYVFHSGSAKPDDPRGYFANRDRRQYDFQTAAGQGRGMITGTVDSLHNETINPLGHRIWIDYDKYSFLPKTVTDAAGLSVQATYDYRVLQPKQVTDPNANLSSFSYSPLGLLSESFVRGQTNTEGDQNRSSVRIEHGFRTFENSPPANRQPIYVRTIRQVHHDTEVDVALPMRDEAVVTVEYSDGFGRLLQARTQGEEVRFGDACFGGGESVLPAKQSDGAGGDLVGVRNTDELKPNVVVSGWQIYDNKGQVVEKYEPFFAEGWEYERSTDSTKGQKVSIFYDPRGHTIRVRKPDGSEQRTICGVPGTIGARDLEHPDVFEPTPWEAYNYDANDNAVRTHAASSSDYEHHWNTPNSLVIDALGRTIVLVERNRDPRANPGDPLSPLQQITTHMTYDVRGNLLSLSDGRARTAFRQTYDYSNRPLSIDSIDQGTRQTVFDAAGTVIEQRDGKGALTLRSYDRLNRPIRVWSRDGVGRPRTLRERMEYGDGGVPDQLAAHRASNRAANRLGRLSRYFDDAGLFVVNAYDFKGNVLEKTRRVVSDAAILNVFNGPPASWNIESFRVDWTNLAAANNSLDNKEYTSVVSYDALNRVRLMTYPEDVEGKRRGLRPHYNKAGALERVEMETFGLGGAAVTERFVEHLAYNAKGQRVMIAYANGIMTRQAYDPQTFRLSRLRTERFTKPGELIYRHTGSPLQELAYEYELVGNVNAIHDRTPGSGVAASQDLLDCLYTYDALYRLRAANGRECDVPPPTPPNLPWTMTPRCTDITRTRRYEEHYEYDVVGNIVKLSHTHFRADGTTQGINRDFEVEANTNRLQKVTIGGQPFAYSYDANGNMTSETSSRHFEWDHLDRLTVYRTQTVGNEPSVHAHYLYDGAGQRVKKLVRKQGGLIEVTVYVDGIFEYHRVVQLGVIEENNTLHVMDNDRRIATVRIGAPFSDDLTPAFKYYLSDHLGSSNVVIDESGNLINREEYTPFGETSFGSFARKRYRFAGKETDEESGLIYFGARYYATWLGRWTSCDPAGLVDGINLYSYVSNNPLRFSDTFGMDSCESSAGGTCSPDTTNVPPPDTSGLGSAGGLPRETPPDINYGHAENREPEGETITINVNDLPSAPPEPTSTDTTKHVPAGTYSNLPPGGAGEPEWTNPPWEEGTGPFIQGFGTGVEHAVIDQAEGLTSNIPDVGQHEFLENQKDVVPSVANDSGFLGWALGFMLANAAIIFGTARVMGGSGGGGGGGAGKNLKLNLGGEGEAAGYTDVNPMIGNKATEAEIRARNPTGGFVKAGAEALPFESESASEIIANKLPPQVVGRNASKIASEIKRVLKPGGTARFTTGSQLSPETKAIFEQAGFTCDNFGCRIQK